MAPPLAISVSVTRSLFSRTAALGLAWVPVLPAVALDRSPAPLEGLDKIVRELRDSRLPHASEEEAIVKRMLPAVEQELPEVFVILATREVPALNEHEEPQRLSDPQTELLTAAVALLDRTTVLEHLDDFLVDSKNSRARALEIEIVGSVGRAEDAARVIKAALPPGEARLDSWVEKKLRSALSKLMGRDERTYANLLAGLRQIPDAVLRVSIFAVGDAGDPRGMELLEAIASWKPGLALQAISQVRRIGASPSEHLNRSMIDTVHRFFDRDRPDRCQTVVLALGELEDLDSIPLMLELLENGTPAVRQSAVWALQRISGMAFGENLGLWSRWYQNEQDWNLEHRMQAFDDLRSSNPSRATGALKEIARHRLHRHALALELADAFSHLAPDLQPFACKVLGQLGSRRALSVLLQALGEDEGVLADAAHDAILRITSVDHRQRPQN